MENKIDFSCIEKIQLFLEYRRICSYIFIYKLWGKEGLSEQQELYLKNMRYSMENGEPFVEIDFNSLKTQ